MALSTKIKSEALQSLYDRYIRDDPQRIASVEREMLNAEVARNLYDLRNRVGLSQEELSESSGVEISVISDIEESDYDGDALEMLIKIAASLGKTVELEYLASKSSESSGWPNCARSEELSSCRS